MKVGYCRVSSEGQNLDAQRKRLEAEGCEKIFEEKVSGRNITDRPEFQACIEFLREGDTLVATRMDRVSRGGAGETCNLLDSLTARKITYKFLDEPLLDTTTPMGEVMVALVAALNKVFLAQNKQRQRDGIEAAKERGIYKGRKPTVPREKVIELLDQKVGPSQIARTLEIGESSVFRIKREHEAATIGQQV
jgi:DNA invertase Pin-like site-specific DNA recombinase